MRRTKALQTIAAIVAVVALGLAGSAGCKGRGAKEEKAGAPAATAYTCPMHPQIVRDKLGDCPICGMALVPKQAAGQTMPQSAAASPGAIRFYRHPMNPAIRSDTPAKDDMGMDYVAVREGEEGMGGAAPAPLEGRAAIQIPPDRVQTLGIRSEPVTMTALEGGVRTVGRVEVDERLRVDVHTKYEGYIERVFVAQTGQPVRSGQALFSVYSPELVAAQNELLAAVRSQGRLAGSSLPEVAEGSRDLLAASRQRLRYYDLSTSEIAAIERSGVPRRAVTVTAPRGGYVVEKAAVQGMRVGPGDRLYQIADLSTVWILADVYERDMGAVRIGTAATVELPYQSGGAFSGKVTFLAPSVEAETRTLKARIEMRNPGLVLRPGMFTNVVLATSSGEALVVPDSALVRTGQRTLVFVDQGGGRYLPREITLGQRTSGGYEVRSGLTAGERVVLSATFLVDSESSIRGAIAAAAEPSR